MPADVAADAQFRARFDREARSISQLSHPHICALYDVGEAEGTAFLVMELLQGGTLAERLKRGALPLGDALKVAIDIAAALTAAHRQGIVLSAERNTEEQTGGAAERLSTREPIPCVGCPCQVKSHNGG